MTRPLDPLPPISDGLLDELTKASTEAFPRPWRIDVDEEGDARHVIQPVYDDGEEQEVVVAAECWDEEFARFIVAATNALPSLLAEVRAARAGRDATPEARVTDASLTHMAEEIRAGRGSSLSPSVDALVLDLMDARAALAGRDARATPGTRCTTCGLPMSDPNHDGSIGPPGCPGPSASPESAP